MSYTATWTAYYVGHGALTASPEEDAEIEKMNAEFGTGRI